MFGLGHGLAFLFLVLEIISIKILINNLLIDVLINNNSKTKKKDSGFQKVSQRRQSRPSIYYKEAFNSFKNSNELNSSKQSNKRKSCNCTKTNNVNIIVNVNAKTTVVKNSYWYVN